MTEVNYYTDLLLTWVLREVETLGPDRRQRAVESLDRIGEVFGKIAGLHCPINGPTDNIVCEECSVDDNIYTEWPCETTRIMVG